MTTFAPRTVGFAAPQQVQRFLELQYARDCTALRTGPLSWAPAIRGLSPTCESAFESGGLVARLGENSPWQLFGRPSGAETIMGSRWATEKDRDAYLQWQRMAGFSHVPAAIGHQAWRAVADFARRNDLTITIDPDAVETVTSLTDRQAQEMGSQLLYVDKALQSFPYTVLPTGSLRGAALFSARVGMRGSALYGCFDNGIATVYAGLCTGSRRFFLATLIHELGHGIGAQYDLGSATSFVPLERRRHMDLWYQTIREKNAFLGLDESLSENAASRRARQAANIGEFLAEMHLLYTVAGDRLRQHIRQFRAETGVRWAWDAVYRELSQRIYVGKEFFAAQEA